MSDFGPQRDKILAHFQSQLRQVRTGRAQPSLVEELMVEVGMYGGARMKLAELASISAPDANLLVIKPFVPQTIKDIEKAFMQNADLGLSPVVKEDLIQIVIPPLTQERREQMVKQVKTRLEEAKIALRNARSDVKELIELQKGEPGVSEDDITRQVADLQKEVDAATTELESMVERKNAELMQV